MKTPWIFPVTLTLGLMTFAGWARAEPCRVVDRRVQSAKDPRWQRAVLAFARELAGVPESSCDGIWLTLTDAPDGVEVRARTREGLEARRDVPSPNALLAVAFGLLAAAPTEPPLALPDPRDLPPIAPPLLRPPPREHAELVSHLSVSASTGVRRGFPTHVLMYDCELRADLWVHSWLVTIGLRGTPFALSPRLANDPDAYDETSLAFGLGRELRLGRSALALTAGPNLTYIWMENDKDNLSTEHAQFRVAGVVRWGYPITSHVRLNITGDGELAPSGIASHAYEMGLAPFPAYTLGLRLGAEVSL